MFLRFNTKKGGKQMRAEPVLYLTPKNIRKYTAEVEQLTKKTTDKAIELSQNLLKDCTEAQLGNPEFFVELSQKPPLSGFYNKTIVEGLNLNNKYKMKSFSVAEFYAKNPQIRLSSQERKQVLKQDLQTINYNKVEKEKAIDEFLRV